MNARQAAKAAAKRIEKLEALVAGQTQDIKDLYAAILDHISGESLCRWCEEYPVCHLKAKNTASCPEWWLRYRKGSEGGKWPLGSTGNGIDDAEGKNDSENVLSDGAGSGEGVKIDPGKDPAL
jgi:hypothetical protein